MKWYQNKVIWKTKEQKFVKKMQISVSGQLDDGVYVKQKWTNLVVLVFELIYGCLYRNMIYLKRILYSFWWNLR